MSDADLSGGAPAPASEAPVSTPAPAPEAAPATPSAPEPTPRNAVDRAFEAVEKLDAPAEKPASSEAPAADKPAGERERDPVTGQFKAKEGVDPAKPGDTKQGELPLKPEEQKPAVAGEAPARFSADAKAAWKDTPESVRGEAARAVRELEAGLLRYKADATAYNDVREFDALAKEQGTTLKAAMSHYLGMENMLRKDFGGGILQICKNMNVDPKAVAEYLTGQKVEGGSSPNEAALRSEIDGLKQTIGTLQTMVQKVQTAPIEQQVQDFASQNPLFNYIANDIAEELDLMAEAGESRDLKAAYERALARHPHLRPAHTPAPQPAPSSEPKPAAPAAPKPDLTAQTEKGRLSLSGGPSGGSDPTTRKPATSPRSALDRAFAQVGMS